VKISSRTEYGVRILVTLAKHHGEGPLSLAGISRAERLPHAYLEQLVGDLRRAGLLTATRGQSGGYQLSRPPEEITVADAMRVLEGPLVEMPCAGPENLEACDRPVPCSVHEVFQRVHEALDGTLGRTTIADVAAGAGGPPYPTRVRKQRIAAHAAAHAARGAESSSRAGARPLGA
jgi:Rrf2 family cysteine metabolism transcriptional repressor